jgi:uncharacterized membrane protein YdbT with pleckstrin-like domain
MGQISEKMLPYLKEVYPFSDLDSETLALILPTLEEVQVPAGTVIFAANDPANALYFLLSGKVTLKLQKKKEAQSHTLQQFDPYDHFGEESLFTARRMTTAITTTPAVLVFLSRANLEALRQESALLDRIFKMFAATFHNLCVTEFKWRSPGETLYIVLRDNPFFLWTKLIPIAVLSLSGFGWLLFEAFTAERDAFIWIVLALLALSLGIVFSVWDILAWRNEYFALTKDRVLVQKLLIGLMESRQETPIPAILSVGMSTSLAGRLLGYGRVTARSYTGNLALDRIPNADLVMKYLDHRRSYLQAELNRQEKEAMQSMLEQRLHPGQAKSIPSAPSQNSTDLPINYYGDSFSDLLAKFFRLRAEKDEAIIYHTHWMMLLVKQLVPNLLLIASIVLFLLRFLDVFTLNASLIYATAILVAITGWAWWFYQYVDWRNDVYIITPDQVVDVDQRPLGHENRRAAPLKNIQMVDYRRNGIVAMALNFGTVRIQIGNEELTFDNVYNPAVVQTEIFNHFREFNDRARKMDRNRMTEWFATYNQLREQKKDENSSQNE